MAGDATPNQAAKCCTHHRSQRMIDRISFSLTTTVVYYDYNYNYITEPESWSVGPGSARRKMPKLKTDKMNIEEMNFGRRGLAKRGQASRLPACFKFITLFRF